MDARLVRTRHLAVNPVLIEHDLVEVVDDGPVLSRPVSTCVDRVDLCRPCRPVDLSPCHPVARTPGILEDFASD